MKSHKVLQNEFTYTPLHLIPGMPPRKPDNRLPLLWLARKGGELYLVNDSGETLDWVGTGVGGFISADDEILPVSSAKDYIYEYKQVLFPGRKRWGQNLCAYLGYGRGGKTRRC